MVRVGRVTIRDKQIQHARMDIESVIAHCIAHNLEVDPGFPVDWYIEQCKAILKRTSIPDYLIIDILDEAEDKGVHEKAPESDGAAQIHPEANDRLLKAVGKLAVLF